MHSLPERLLFGKCRKVGDHLTVMPESKLNLCAQLARDEAELVQPGDLGGGEVPVCHILQRRSPPQCKRLVEILNGGLQSIGSPDVR